MYLNIKSLLTLQVIYLPLLQKFKAWLECIVLVFGEILQNTVKPV